MKIIKHINSANLGGSGVKFDDFHIQISFHPWGWIWPQLNWKCNFTCSNAVYGLHYECNALHDWMRLKESQRLQNITLLLLHYPHVKHYNKLKTATLRSFRENGCASTRRHPAEEGICPVRSARSSVIGHSVIGQSVSTSVDATATAAAATQLPTRWVRRVGWRWLDLLSFIRQFLVTNWP